MTKKTTAPDLEDLDRQYADEAGGKPKPNGPVPPLPRILSAAAFLKGFTPQRPLLKAWDLKRGWLYSFTAPTGGAKTAIALHASIDLASTGLRVVYLAGENADDVRARGILAEAKLAQPLPQTLHFVDRTFSLHDGMNHLRAELLAIGGADLAIVDTSPAFQTVAGATDENSNPEAIRWALRLREITRLEGKPTVIALCHPIKRPQAIDDCLPRGGGGFLAEMDGNYASWPVADNGSSKFFELRWIGKFRGNFEPVTYRLDVATCKRLTDPDGVPIYSVFTMPADEQQIELAAADQTEDEDSILAAMADYPGKSLADWAKLLGWQKWRVQRVVARLVKGGFARLARGHYHLTTTGKAEAKRASESIRKQAK